MIKHGIFGFNSQKIYNLVSSSKYGKRACMWSHRCFTTSQMNIFDRKTKLQQKRIAASYPDHSLYDYLRDEVTIITFVFVNNSACLKFLIELTHPQLP